MIYNKARLKFSHQKFFPLDLIQHKNSFLKQH